MNRLKFIFAAVNAIASIKHEAFSECLLAEVVHREIETAKLELHPRSVIGGSGR